MVKLMCPRLAIFYTATPKIQHMTGVSSAPRTAQPWQGRGGNKQKEGKGGERRGGEKSEEIKGRERREG